MATLYDTLVQQGVAPNQTYATQKQLYEKLGSPKGNYTGSYDQNVYLLSQLSGKHYNDILGGGGGGGGSSGGSSPPAASSYSVGNPNDYYSQALSLLQPGADAQIAPLKAAQGGLDAAYAQKKTELGQNLQNTKDLYANTQQGIQQNADASRRDIASANMAQQGQQRANAAARGFVPGSGVEQSAEANIQQGADRQLTDMTNRISTQLKDLGIHESIDEQTINNEIANLPSQEAAQALDYATQIAKIQGQTWTEAVKMGTQMLHQASVMAMEQQKFDEATQYHQDEIALRQMSINIQQQRADRVGSGSGKGQVLTDSISSMGSALEGIANSYGNVDYQDYNKARQQWVNSGLPAKQFDSNFSSYVDPNRTDNKYAGVKYKKVTKGGKTYYTL